MKVHELIDWLDSVDPEMEVKMTDPGCGCCASEPLGVDPTTRYGETSVLTGEAIPPYVMFTTDYGW